MLLATALFLVISPLKSVADVGDRFTADGFNFEVTSEEPTTVKLLSSETDDETVIIPSKVTNDETEYTVTALGELAFLDKSMTSVGIPATIVEIGKNAFAGCFSLKQIRVDAILPPTCDGELFNFDVSQCRLIYPEESYVGYSTAPQWSQLKFDFEYAQGDFLFGITPGLRDCKLVGYTGASGYANIPETVTFTVDNETETIYTVTAIGDEAFKGLENLFKVKFPSTLISIGAGAFEDCIILNFDEFPDKLQSIGDRAFKGCDAIKRIKLPETVETLGEWCFANMKSLQRAILFSKLTEIPTCAFRECEALEEVYLPEQLKKIGDEAFMNCLMLDEVQFPSTLEEIGDLAFHGGAASRQGLQRAVLPLSVKEIGTAFQHSDLHKIDLGAIEHVQAGAFQYCYDLQEVKFSPNLKTIGQAAFALCGANAGRAMTAVVLPETVEAIAEEAFNGSAILSLTIGDKITALPSKSCGTPRILNLGSGVKNIASDAINFENLTIISIKAPVPPTVAGGFPLTAEQQREIVVIVPDEDAKELYLNHEYWKEFRIVVLENSAATVELDGTDDLATAIYKVSHIMPAEVTRLKVIGHLTDHDFEIMKSNMLSLMYLDMSGGDNEEIPAQAFENKISLETVILPKGLKRINDNAFTNCSSMNISELPDGIEYIGTNAFAHCGRLTVTKMPESLKELGYAAFVDCVSLKSLTFGPNLEKLNGVSFSSCDNLEYVDMSAATKLKDLSFNTFYVNYVLSTLILPSSIENIGSRTICGTAIKTLTLPGSLKTLEQEALTGNKFRVITLGEGITTLPEYVLCNNTRLITVNLPSTLQKMSDNAFENSKKISAISSLAVEAPEASVATFDDINTRTCVLSIPEQSMSSYLSAIGWGMFSNIENSLVVDIPEDIEVTTIPEEDYQDLVEEEESEQRALESAEAKDNDEEETPAKDPGDKENAGDNENQVTPEQQMAALRSVAIQKQRETSNALLDGSLFCKLNNGTVMASEENPDSKGHRVFIRSTSGKPITSVKINGVEMIDKMEGNSLIIPAGSAGKIVINGGTTSNPTIGADKMAATNNVYDLSGRCVLVNATKEQIDRLDKGVYIIGGKKVLVQ